MVPRLLEPEPLLNCRLVASSSKHHLIAQGAVMLGDPHQSEVGKFPIKVEQQNPHRCLGWPRRVRPPVGAYGPAG